MVNMVAKSKIAIRQIRIAPAELGFWIPRLKKKGQITQISVA